MLQSRALGSLVVCGVVLCSAAPAVGQTMHKSPHMEETANIVGLKGGAVGAFNDGRSAFGGGFGPFYERNVIPGWLEIEAAVAFGFFEGEQVVAFDVFLKKPFHVNETVNPYVGVGPNVSILIGRAETDEPEATERREVRTRAGILFAAGGYFWFGERKQWGLDAELVYLLLFNNGLTHELAVEAGPTFRF